MKTDVIGANELPAEPPIHEEALRVAVEHAHKINNVCVSSLKELRAVAPETLISAFEAVYNSYEKGEERQRVCAEIGKELGLGSFEMTHLSGQGGSRVPVGGDLFNGV